MSYANIVNISCADKVEFFCRLRDFICKRNGTYDYSATGIGWTHWDSSYAVDEDNPASGDYFVIFSPGESGDDDLYIKITWTTGALKCQFYQSWDPSTHAGSTAINTADNLTLADTGSLILYVYGNLDFCFIVNYLTTDGRVCYFGKGDPFYDDQTGEICTCSSSLTAGSDVSITVDAVPENWAVGSEFFIRTTHTNNTSTVKIEKATIKTLVGNTITADLINSYTAGSKLTDSYPICVQSSTAGFASFVAFITHYGNFLNEALTLGSLTSFDSYIDPDYYEDRIALMDTPASSTNAPWGMISYLRRTPTQNAEFTTLDVLQEKDGTQWRCFKAYSSKYVAIKEV